jgi:hypothetical protein
MLGETLAGKTSTLMAKLQQTVRFKSSRDGYIRLKITQEQARALGIVFCENCGCPPNNHWDYVNSCAHHTTCKKFKEVISLARYSK